MIAAARRRIKTPFTDSGSRHSANRFGMFLFLVSLGVLFAASIVGFVIVRWQLSQRGLWPQELPSLPRGLWAGTALILISSFTMHRAFTSTRDADHRDDLGRIGRALASTWALGAVFLGLQVACWIAWFAVVRANWAGSDQWRFALMGFYVLSGLHAVHVVGGLIALGFAIGPLRTADEPWRRRLVESCTMYWHFLTAVWLVLFALLLAGG